jgi:hypothetical protein
MTDILIQVASELIAGKFHEEGRCLTDCWNCCYDLPQFKLVKNCCLRRKKLRRFRSSQNIFSGELSTRVNDLFCYLSGGIETDHEYSHFLFTEHTLPDAGKMKSHFSDYSLLTTRMKP